MTTHPLRHLAVLAVVALTLLSAGAQARNPAALLKKGNQLFSNADYQAAFDVFAEGYKQKKDAAFLRSMVFCQLKLYQHPKARELLQEYVRSFPRAQDIKTLKDLEASLDVVIQTRIKIASNPSGAAIYIDAEVAGKVGATPTEITIEPGKHLLILKAKGYHPTTRTFDIQAKQSLTLSVPMEVPVEIGSIPEGASIHVGSASSPSLGNTPLKTGIVPGKQKVFFKLAGYRTTLVLADLQLDRPNTIQAALELGLMVSSRPAGATVELDGKVVGKTPLDLGASAGQHSVTVRYDPCKPVTRSVTMQPGASNRVAAHLSGCGMLSMRTDVQGAAVTVAGTRVGETPLTEAAVVSGRQPVAVTHPDRRSWSGALDFSGTEVVDARIKLGRKAWPVWVLGGVALAGAIVGAVGTGLAAKRKSDGIITDDDGVCRDTSIDTSLDRDANKITCGSAYKFHHMATAGWTIAGTAAASGLLYYLLFVRGKSEVTRTPVKYDLATAIRPTGSM